MYFLWIYFYSLTPYVPVILLLITVIMNWFYNENALSPELIENICNILTTYNIRYKRKENTVLIPRWLSRDMDLLQNYTDIIL